MPIIGTGYRSALSYIRIHSILIICILLKIVLYLSAQDYGYFRDELYFIALSDAPSFGYVDVPPAAPFILWISRHLFGSSLLAIHLVPTILSIGTLVIIYLFVKRLGGGSISQVLALASTAVAPQLLGVESIYTYDSFDIFFQILALYFLMRFFIDENKRFLYLFGFAAGLALLSKVSILFLGFAVALSFLFTKRRTLYLKKEIYIAGLLALIIFSPYIIWQFYNGFPTLDFFSNYASGKTYPATPLEFLKNQIIVMGPLTFPIWIIGLYSFARAFEGKLREFTIVYFILFILFAVLKAKYYMIVPIIPILIAAGSVSIESRILSISQKRFAYVYVMLITVTGLFASTMAMPLLPINTLIKISSRFGGDASVKNENHTMGLLPQHFADRFGWPEMAASLQKACDTLSKDEKEKAVIITGNYGEAGAARFFGKNMNLPKVISGHNQYYLLGPGEYTGEIVIAYNIGSKEDLEKIFESVTEAARFDHPYAMPYERNMPIYVCRKPNTTLKEAWHMLKHFN